MQQQRVSLLPKNNLLYQSSQPLECSICYDKALHFMQCTGPCQQLFCLHCISNIKRRGISCPSRCSEVFATKPVTQNKLLFSCPFSPLQCTPMSSLKEFKTHITACPFMGAAALLQLTNKQQYRCVKGHDLRFLKHSNFQSFFPGQEFYDFIQQQSCSVCSEKMLARSICIECDAKAKFYCKECRPLPMSRKECGFGHQLEPGEEVEEDFFEMLCDFCGGSIVLCGNEYYSDNHCDLDICMRCFECFGENLSRRLEEEEAASEQQGNEDVEEVDSQGDQDQSIDSVPI